MPVMRLYANKSAMIRYSAPDANYSGAAQYTMQTVYGSDGHETVADFLALGFDKSPLYGKSLLNQEGRFEMDIGVYVSSMSSVRLTRWLFNISALGTGWTEGGVTYRQIRRSGGTYAGGWRTGNVSGYVPNAGVLFEESAGRNALDYGILISFSTFPAFTGDASPQISATLLAHLSSSNRPYVDVTYEDASPKISSAFPENTFINKANVVKFSWATNDPGVIWGPQPEQASYNLQWRVKGSAEINDIFSKSDEGTNKFHNLPPDTLPGGDIEWRVRAQSSEGVWSPFSAWMAINTIDAESTAVAVSPANAYINSDEPQEFVWQHIIDTGTQPSKSELEYRIGSGAWTLFHTQNGSATTATIPANTLPGGNVQWRVRTFNTDDLAGEWSAPASIVVQGAPPAPGISSVTNDSRPLVSWQSIGQAAYELKIQGTDGTVYATGEIAGTDKTHKVAEFLPDGDYTAQLRIRGSTQMWSNWATAAFSVSPDKPTKPTLTAERIRGGIRLTTSGVGTLYILRDGVPIAKASGTYNDYAALGTHTYVARSVDGGGYMDSDPVTITAYVDAFTVAAVDDLQNWIELLARRGEKPRTSTELEFVGTAQFFAGRTFPLYTFSEFTQDNRSVSFTFRNPADWVHLRNLLERRQTLLIRDLRGNRYYGVVPSASVEQDAISSDFTLNITRVDYVERIEYD